MSAPMQVAPTPPSRWQFSLFTLLVAMTCVGLGCVALISPGELWKGLVFVLAAGSLLVAGLCIVYRDGRSRAFAVGFVIFGSAYFVFSQGDTPDVPGAPTTLPTTRWGIALYTLLHAENVQTSTTVGPLFPGTWLPQPVPVPVPVASLSPPPAMPIEGVVMTIPAYSTPAADPATDPVDASLTVAETPVAPPVYLPPTVTYLNPVSTTQYAFPRVHLSSFLGVVHHLLVLTLGVLGGIIAQILHSTRREPK